MGTDERRLSGYGSQLDLLYAGWDLDTAVINGFLDALYAEMRLDPTLRMTLTRGDGSPLAEG